MHAACVGVALVDTEAKFNIGASPIPPVQRRSPRSSTQERSSPPSTMAHHSPRRVGHKMRSTNASRPSRGVATSIKGPHRPGYKRAIVVSTFPPPPSPLSRLPRLPSRSIDLHLHCSPSSHTSPHISSAIPFLLFIPPTLFKPNFIPPFIICSFVGLLYAPPAVRPSLPLARRPHADTLLPQAGSWPLQ